MHHAGNGMLTSAYIGDVSAVCYVKALVIITLHSNVRAWLGQVTSSLALYKKSTLILALGKTKLFALTTVDILTFTPF